MKRIRSNYEKGQGDSALRLSVSEKEKTKSVSDEILECKTCSKVFTGIESKEEHMRSEKHQRKLMAQNGDIMHNEGTKINSESKAENLKSDKLRSVKENGQTYCSGINVFGKLANALIAELPGSTYDEPQIKNLELECKICDKIFTGIKSKEEHLTSEKHQKKVLAQDCSVEKTKSDCLLLADPSKIAKAQTDTILECKQCDKIFSGAESKEQHMKSEKHLKKASASNTQVLRCKTCDMSFTGKESEAEHLRSAKHLRKVAFLLPFN